MSKTQFKSYDEIIKNVAERESVQAKEGQNAESASRKVSKQDELKAKQLKNKQQLQLQDKLTTAQLAQMTAEEVFEDVVAGKTIYGAGSIVHTIDSAALALKEANDTFEFYSSLYKDVFGDI